MGIIALSVVFSVVDHKKEGLFCTSAASTYFLGAGEKHRDFKVRNFLTDWWL